MLEWSLEAARVNRVIYVGQVNSPPLLSDQLVIVTVYGETDQYPRALRGAVKTLK